MVLLRRNQGDYLRKDEKLLPASEPEQQPVNRSKEAQARIEEIEGEE